MHNNSFLKPVANSCYYFEIYLYFICMGGVYFYIHMLVHHVCIVPREDRRGIIGGFFLSAIWVLGAKPRSIGRVASALNL